MGLKLVQEASLYAYKYYIEKNLLDGVSSNIQTQLDNKAAKSFAIAQAVALG